MTRASRGVRGGWVLPFVLGLVVGIGGATREGHAARQDSCLGSFNGLGDALADGGTLTCTDCDAGCDGVADGADRKCTFHLRVCLNKPDRNNAACTPADIGSVKVTGAKGLRPTPAGTSSVCGAFVDVDVKLKNKGRRAGTKRIKLAVQSRGRRKRKLRETLTLVCQPLRGTACVTTSTTSTSTTSTTTSTTLPPAVCGNGIKEPGEMCDPPCQQGACAAGQACNSTCTGCVAVGPCACGAPDPTQIRFTTSPGVGICGVVQHEPTAMDPNTNVLELVCGGLYFGGGGVSAPLPSIVPDLGVSALRVSCCQADGVTMELVATTPADPNTTVRTCTSQGVDNGIYPGKGGCLVGTLLPVPSTAPGAVALSTCVVSRVGGNAGGTVRCDTGESSFDLPLKSDVYLTGDLLDGSAADRPSVAGIQPCPICMGTPGAETCQGGPRNGLSCTPGSSGLGGAFPTSHDCPPPPALFMGSLDIPLALTTGASTKHSVDMPAAGGAGQPFVFCGFCGDGTGFANPPIACASDADCAGILGCTSGCTSCRQHSPGAFAKSDARTIGSTGAPAGTLLDRAAHGSTVVGVFCIPPSFIGQIDAAADLPGPGAVAVPGVMQLLP